MPRRAETGNYIQIDFWKPDMLQVLRSSASHFLIKGLMGLIILSFGIWGVQGYLFDQSQTDTVMTVGDQAISGAEVSAAIRQDLRILRARGFDITREQARSLGLLNQTMDRLIDSRLYTLGGDALGMAVSDAAVSAAIRADPTFLNEEGVFSKARFEFLLSQSGFSEVAYAADVRRDIIRRQLLNSLDIPGVAPAGMIKSLHAWREEKRVAELVLVKIDETLDVGEPAQSELEEIHQSLAERFTAPERRSVLFVRLELEDFVPDIEIGEDRVREEYESRKADFTVPEKRIVQQIRFENEEAAKAGAQALAAGKSFADVAREMTGQEGEALAFGEFAPGEIQIPAVANALDGLTTGDSSQPLDMGLGWFIFRVSGTVPEQTLGFEEARERLLDELKRIDAETVLRQTADDLEDTMAGGVTLEEAAETLGLTMRNTGPMDNAGLDKEGNAIADLPQDDFLETAFTSAQGEDSRLVETAAGGYYLLRVETITPSALQTLDQVRNDVIAVWKEEKRLDAARQRALAMVERIEGGASMADVAAAQGLDPVTAKPVNRLGRDGDTDRLNPALVSDLFSTKPGQASLADVPGGFVVARLKEILPADPAETGSLGEVLANGMVSDVLDQFNTALRNRFKVEVDEAVLARLN